MNKNEHLNEEKPQTSADVSADVGFDYNATPGAVVEMPDSTAMIKCWKDYLNGERRHHPPYPQGAMITTRQIAEDAFYSGWLDAMAAMAAMPKAMRDQLLMEVNIHDNN